MDKIALEQITIRTTLKVGDLGYVICRHAECDFGLNFESYVAKGLFEFYHAYDPSRDRIWICEQVHNIVGFLCPIHRSKTTAQLQYFYLEPQYRGIGLGKN